ncbi:G-patch domain protein (Spp2), putative [Talaromyces stipitatus ATCC 10500]|uniref:Pre-mRNA-splicing factor n=1 Tax=Talaromyces stipitatus (strain ATCC 10500 / CBS 375.48 / QM 6759 / NRRL 1006) TaxID=441959 RepID=B8MKA9_TALSN|nr:G-patch domain protein (Spp2), putative [Talaromyces stipitatus ATCC 10500]EED15264.1 G-patch domain protein (Spp2), putative [Talaromyces stipitatus ATCC 10500]
MLPSKQGSFGTPGKPFSVSFSNASRKPPNIPQNARPRVSSSLRHRQHISHDDSEEEEEVPVAEEVTGFAMGGAISKNTASKKEPLVIKVESKNNWRDRPGTNRRGKNLLPQEVQAAGNVAVVETETPSMSYGLSLAPAKTATAGNVTDEKEADVPMEDAVPTSENDPRAPLTQDEIALQALIRESEGGDKVRRSDIVIASTTAGSRYDETSSFRADVATRPDQASLDAYDAVPVEEFGAALLRGMGWKEGQAIGRGNYGNTSAANEARVPQRRPGFLGIGAKDIGGAKGAEVEIGAWGKAAMRKGSRKGGDGSGNTEGVYMPVVMKSKMTGEHLTEEEFKLRQKEASERKANGRSDGHSSRPSTINGRDKGRTRRYDDESDSDRDRSRRHGKSSTSRQDRSLSSGAHDRRSRRYDDDDDDKRSSRDHRRYRDRADSDYKSRPRSRERSHRDSGHSRRGQDYHRTRDRDRDSDQPHHTSAFDKVFHHRHHSEQDGKPAPPQAKKESEIHKLEGDLKKDEQKLEDYIDKDEELEEQGKTYGVLT